MKTIDPYGLELVEDYNKLIENFGLEKFTKTILSEIPNPNKLMRRMVVFASQDLGPIINAIRKKDDFYILTGIMPSAEKIHLGTRMVIENVKYFQEQGGKTFVLIADLESLATRKIPLEEAKERALSFHIPAYIALGLDPKKTTFYFQSKNETVKNMAFDFSNRITLNEFRAIYGNADPSRMLSALLQAGDILFPQLDKIMPGIVPVGPDQAPHLRLTRDIARRFKSNNFVFPSSIYHKLTPALDGKFKMSKSNPGACINIPEEPNELARKIKNALTGGRASIEEQKKIGGQPEKCMIFELYKQHLIEDDKELQRIYDGCKSGKLLCGEDKKNACELIIKFMKELNQKMEKAKKVKVRFIEN